MIVLPDVINRVSNSETGDFIDTLMFPYGNVGTIGVLNVLYTHTDQHSRFTRDYPGKVRFLPASRGFGQNSRKVQDFFGSRFSFDLPGFCDFCTCDRVVNRGIQRFLYCAYEKNSTRVRSF